MDALGLIHIRVRVQVALPAHYNAAEILFKLAQVHAHGQALKIVILQMAGITLAELIPVVQVRQHAQAARTRNTGIISVQAAAAHIA